MKAYEKLKQNWEFRRAYNKGKAMVTPYFVLYACKGRRDSVRLGITAGKKIGTAVKRNRAKRVITAAFSACANNIISGHDFVAVARTRILETNSRVVAEKMKNQLKNANLWKE